MKHWAGWVAAALLAACGGGGGGGGTGDGGSTVPSVNFGATQLAVLYANGDATSEAIARAYQAARGVPETQVIGVAVNTDQAVIASAEFDTLKAALDARLPAQVQATLVTWTQPSRVAGPSCNMGLTSALAFGYDERWCSNACNGTNNSRYYDHATRRPWTDLGIRPSMMLGAATLAQAQQLIQRGLAADASFVAAAPPTGHAWLMRTSDPLRNVRWSDLQALAATSVPNLQMHYVDNSAGAATDVVSGQRNVMFMFTGLAVVPDLASNTWLPGAVGDSLTSTAGLLPDGNGQTPVTAWLDAGATASYGNVEEPCNFLFKFPRASVLVKHYRSGQTLIEAYWKSVQTPGQGLFVGEPLAHPWSR
jgi:uncharacterized protein (TIGR03790 family)